MKLVLAAVVIVVVLSLCGCGRRETLSYTQYKEMVDMCGLTSYEQMKACYDSLERAKLS